MARPKKVKHADDATPGTATENAEAQPSEDTQAVDEELAKQPERGRPIRWMLVSFDDGRCYKYPARMVAEKLCAVYSNLDFDDVIRNKALLVQASSDLMSWVEISQKAVPVEIAKLQPWQAWKVAPKDVLEYE